MSKNALVTFMDALNTALADGTFVRLTLANYKGEDKTLKRIIAARTLIKGKDHLSFTYRHQTRDITKNALIIDALQTVQTAIEGFTANLATLGTQSKSLERQGTFVGKLQDAMVDGVSNLVDADLAKESAKLTSLQTKQQLGVQALSIANSSSSILLSLFR